VVFVSSVVKTLMKSLFSILLLLVARGHAVAAEVLPAADVGRTVDDVVALYQAKMEARLL
jgi:hypothetical protein